MAKAKKSRAAHDPSPEPTPEDPREHEPMRDPPAHEEHDDGVEGPLRQAGAPDR